MQYVGKDVQYKTTYTYIFLKVFELFYVVKSQRFIELFTRCFEMH